MMQEQRSADPAKAAPPHGVWYYLTIRSAFYFAATTMPPLLTHREPVQTGHIADQSDESVPT
ncbi:hypothetical protein EB75_24105 [Mycobacterium sp. ST-F2]|nr:hypothetical protein EB75_24105 [Mycobacterium sp. ST-F2]